MNVPTLTTRHIVAIVGSFLTVVGILTVIGSSWDTFSSMGRVMTVFLPLLVLYGVYTYIQKRQENLDIGRYSLFTASLILPFVVGVIGYELGVYDEVNADTVAALAALSALNAGLIEFLHRDRNHAVLTLGSLFVATAAFGSWLELKSAGLTILFSLLGALILAVGLSRPTLKPDFSETAWHSTGFVLLITSLAIFPLSLADELDLRDGENMWLVPLIYTLVGGLLLLIAVLYSRLWQLQKDHTLFHHIRSFSEQIAPLLIVAPATIASLSSSDPEPFFILLLASSVVAVISAQVNLPIYRYIALIGFGAAIIRLVLLGLEQLSLAWPLILISLGILMVLAAAFGKKGRAFADSLLQLPQTSWEQLGEPLPHTPDAPKPATNSSSTSWLWFWLLIGALFLLMFF
jgi:hypothetical protein